MRPRWFLRLLYIRHLYACLRCRCPFLCCPVTQAGVVVFIDMDSVIGTPRSYPLPLHDDNFYNFTKGLHYTTILKSQSI